MSIAVVGRSEAGQRIHAKGEAFRRSHEPNPPPRAPVPPPAPVAVPAALTLPARALLGTRHQVTFILMVVAAYHGISVAELIAPQRNRRTNRARQIAMYLARKTGTSLQELGRRIGGRDHTTVLHGVRVVTARLEIDPATAKAVAELRVLLGDGP